MGRSLQALVSGSALLHNLQRVREIAPGRSVLAMVKANGYGHGLVATAKILQCADALGVASLEEAIELRQGGITNRIVLMEGFVTELGLANIFTWRLETVIHHSFQLDMLAKYANNSPNAVDKVKAWIKINTGMNRLGFTPEACLEYFASITKYCNIMGIMTHFSDADNIDNPKTQHQIAAFSAFISKLKLVGKGNYPCSLANSAAILAWPETHADWVRPGLMLYGVAPFRDSVGADFNLRPAMQLVAKVIAINVIGKGESIGYSSRFVCPANMPVGVLAIGYADGYTSMIPDGAPVLVRRSGHKTKVIGRVSMDMVTIDLRGCGDVQIGDEVVLWGDGLPVEEVARSVGMIPYELLTSVGLRATRIYSKDEYTSSLRAAFSGEATQ